MHLKSIYKKYVLIVICFIVFLGLGIFLKSLKTSLHTNFKVVLIAKVIKDDTFQFFFLDGDEDSFSIENSIKSKVKGSVEFQKITFHLPRLEKLNKLRLDIGANPDQGPILIKEIKFLTDDKEISFKGDFFDNLFKANNYIKKLEPVGAYQGLKSKGKEGDFFDPYFISRQSSEEFKALKSRNVTKYPFLISAFVISVIFLFLYNKIETVSITKEAIFIIGFIILITIPYFQEKFTLIKPEKSLEKRTLSLKPKFEFSSEYPKKYEEYFNDNFGFRNHFINWGGIYRTKLFRSSMHSELVKFGKEDWLFYNRVDGKIFGSYTNSNLISKDTLKKIVEKWEQNKKRYNNKGAMYFLSFWPNKHTIYKEYLPSTMKTQIKDTLSRIDQILQYLKDTESPIALFDPRPFLIDEKKSHQLYHKFDTHWNDYGAFIGYQSFFNSIFDELGIKPKNSTDFNIKWANFEKGELIQMLGIQNDGFFKEMAPTFELKKQKDQIEFLSTDGFPRLTKRTRNEYCGNKLKVLVFRDSYTTKLIQFISLHFYEVTYIWGHGERYVDLLEPDIVIEGYVERDTGQRIQ